MAELLIKDLSEDLLRRLEERAKAHGRTVEAEAVAVLEERVRLPERAAEPTITTAEWAERIASTSIGELDPDELRDHDDLGREFDFDPVHGTTVRYVQRTPRPKSSHRQSWADLRA